MRRALTFALVCLCLTPGQAMAAPNDQAWSMQWNLRAMRADRAWATSKGAGVVVAVIDTGVDLGHPDLQGRLVAGADLIDGGDPQDVEGRGTHMAGIIAAATGNTIGVASVAPSAKIMPIRVLDAEGEGRSETVADGVRYAVSHGAKVVNLSLAEDRGGGGPRLNLFSASLDDAISDAARAGVLVVAAAGNNFGGAESQTAYDAKVGGVLVVGASTPDDQRAAYSNYGGGLDVLAPGGGNSDNPSSCVEGEEILSTWWTPSDGSTYGSGCGSSMAVAHVSGVAALLMARGHSNRSAAERIVATAVDLGTPGRDNLTGYGRADALAAVGAAPAAPPQARRPTPPRRTSAPAVGAAGASTPAPPPSTAPATAPTQAPEPVAEAPLAFAPGPYAFSSESRAPLAATAGALVALIAVCNAFVRYVLFARRSV